MALAMQHPETVMTKKSQKKNVKRMVNPVPEKKKIRNALKVSVPAAKATKSNYNKP